MADLTKSQLETIRDKADAKITEILDGTQKHARDDFMVEEAKLSDLMTVRDAFARKAKRVGSLPSARGKFQ